MRFIELKPLFRIACSLHHPHPFRHSPLHRSLHQPCPLHHPRPLHHPIPLHRLLAPPTTLAPGITLSLPLQVYLTNAAKDEPDVLEVRIWSDAVANLTLMALGSSAPEILLSCIEVIGECFVDLT